VRVVFVTCEQNYKLNINNDCVLLRVELRCCFVCYVESVRALLCVWVLSCGVCLVYTCYIISLCIIRVWLCVFTVNCRLLLV